MKVEWETETINDRPNELIPWRSLPHALVEHAGCVHFQPALDGHGTIVRVVVQYDPPTGELEHAVASLFDADADRQIEEDLTNFKDAMEAGLGAA
jgi:uncharacterized membrane protein